MTSSAFMYENSDVPEGVTLGQWRASREAARRETQRSARRARRAAWQSRVLRAIGRRPAVCVACLAGLHVGHTALGLGGFEGLEAVLLQAVQSDHTN